MNRRNFLKAALAATTLAVLPVSFPLPTAGRDYMEQATQIVMDAFLCGEISLDETETILKQLQEPGPHHDLLKAVLG
jgi:hypothetical protein